MKSATETKNTALKITDMLPGLDDKALAMVHANAVRLMSAGDARQQEQAETLLPLVDAERAQRAAAAAAAAPPRKAAAPRKSRAKKPADA